VYCQSTNYAKTEYYDSNARNAGHFYQKLALSSFFIDIRRNSLLTVGLYYVILALICLRLNNLCHLNNASNVYREVPACTSPQADRRQAGEPIENNCGKQIKVKQRIFYFTFTSESIL